MVWWYELRGADDRLVELRRGFASEAEARQTFTLTVRAWWMIRLWPQS